MNEKILVVDDEINILNVIKDYLIREKYEVFTASRGNGDYALEESLSWSEALQLIKIVGN